jgi:hypothetical protein
MRRGCRESHGRAEVVSTTSTRIARIASYARLEGDAVANLKVFDIRSAFFYDAGGFVAEDYGGFDDVVADATVLPVVNLG